MYAGDFHSSWKSKTFPEYNLSMQRTDGSCVIISQEDLREGKARKISLDLKIGYKIAEAVSGQVKKVKHLQGHPTLDPAGTDL